MAEVVAQRVEREVEEEREGSESDSDRPNGRGVKRPAEENTQRKKKKKKTKKKKKEKKEEEGEQEQGGEAEKNEQESAQAEDAEVAEVPPRAPGAKREEDVGEGDGEEQGSEQREERGAENMAEAQPVAKQKEAPEHRLDPDGPVGAMLSCTICLTQPEAEIFQCSNGHLLCADCHTRVASQDACVCPSCRVRMSRSNPTRNYVAEKARDQLPAHCPHQGCGVELTVARLGPHQREECEHRPATCIYAAIGCGWTGTARDQQDHQGSCTYASMTGADIVGMVAWRHLQEEEQRKASEQAQATANSVLGLISARARNIEVRDVRLEYDEVVNDTSSTSFHALGETWVVTLRQRQASGQKERGVGRPKEGRVVEWLGLRVARQTRGSSRQFRRLRLTLAVVKGPSLAMALPPSIHHISLGPRDRRSDYLPLPVEGQAAAQLAACHNIHLRLVFVDTRNGLTREFTSLRDHHTVEGEGRREEESDGWDDDEDSQGSPYSRRDSHPNYLPPEALEEMLSYNGRDRDDDGHGSSSGSYSDDSMRSSEFEDMLHSALGASDSDMD